MVKIIDGKLVSSVVRKQITDDTTSFIKEFGVVPGLAVIIVGEDSASKVYVRNKHKACLEVGFNSFQIELAESTQEDDLLKIIDKLNNDNAVHGILVQLPLPKHISEKNVIERISPIKDVDAFHPTNVGKIMIGDYSFLPCTPAGVIELLDYYKIDICSKKCVVLGRSNIVGKPMAMLLMQRNGTVTICHSKTNDIESICKEADIIVCAIGKCEFLKANMIKPGAVVIDVGINRDSNGKLCGDVKFDEAKEVASMITPVPGGVGPMTITMLLKNTLMAAKIQTEERK